MNKTLEDQRARLEGMGYALAFFAGAMAGWIVRSIV